VPSLTDQAAALEPLLVARKGQWPILIGHSLGGPIVAKAAAMYPDKVGAIVIVSGALDPAQEHVLFIQRVGNAPLVRWLLPRWARNSNCELIPLKGELETLASELPDIHCPIVIVHGRKDQLVPFANVAYMQAAFAGNDHVAVLTLDDANHFIPWTHKPMMDRAIQQAIDMLRQSAQPSRLKNGNQDAHQALDHHPHQPVATPQNASFPS
jgi:pimeloyl-ACP methyl ester carboxylesterase